MDKVFNNDTPIYIAGHTGLIGSAFLRRFQSEGFTRLITKTHSELDLTSQCRVESFFSEYRPDIVFLCAGRVGGILENRDHPADFILENLSIQLHVISAAFRNGVKRLFFPGSTCMYPRQCPQPMKEQDLLTGMLEPTSLPYALSKLSGLYLCLSLNQQYGDKRFFPVIPNNAYGPNDDFNLSSCHVIPAMLRRFHDAKVSRSEVVTLWGTGTPRREFVHADDIADACLYLLRGSPNEFELPINIGAGKDHSIRELAEMVSEIVDFKGMIEFDAAKPDGAPKKLLDSSQIFSLGWRPKKSLEEGLRATYEWFLKKVAGD